MTENQDFEIIKLILHSFKVEGSKIFPGSHLSDDLHMDTNMIQLLLGRIEDYFSCYFRPSLFSVERIDQLLVLIAKNRMLHEGLS